MVKSSKVKLIVILFFLFIIYFFLNEVLNFSIPCLFHELTGLYCPGCGITRLFFSLLKFDFYQAFRYNPLIFILIILCLIYWIIKILLKKLKGIDITTPNYIYYCLLVVVILFGILRNIPMFDYLAPYIL